TPYPGWRWNVICVIPAQAGTHLLRPTTWIPACAGMTPQVQVVATRDAMDPRRRGGDTGVGTMVGAESTGERRRHHDGGGAAPVSITAWAVRKASGRTPAPGDGAGVERVSGSGGQGTAWRRHTPSPDRPAAQAPPLSVDHR